MRTIALTLAALLILPLVPIHASAGTSVGGSIFTNTTWTLAGSPYDVTSTVVVYPGVKLTIDPGVVVRFAGGTSMIVRGELAALGTAAQPITLTSLAQSSFDWNGIGADVPQGARLSLRHVDVSHAATAIYIYCCHGSGFIRIDHTSFHDNHVALGGYGGSVRAYVDNSTFHHNTYAITQADKVVWSSAFHNNTYGLYATERISVYDSTFVDHAQVALFGGRGVLEFNRVERNIVGLSAFYEGFTARYNEISHNGVGVRMSGSQWPVLEYNNLRGNLQYAVENTGSVNQYARNNHWGTTSTAAIDAMIYDGLDASGRGLVDYLPIAPNPIPTHPNLAPVAHVAPIAPAECVARSGLVTLDATASSDPDGDPLYFLWSAPGVTFADATAAVTTATVPLGTTTITLSVSDGGLTRTLSFPAHVVDTQPPTLTLARPAHGSVYLFDEEAAAGGPHEAAALGPLTIVATPADACGIDHVTFVDGVVLGTVSEAPYEVTTNPPLDDTRVRHVQARAMDAGGFFAIADATVVHVGTSSLVEACATALAESLCALFDGPLAAPDEADRVCRSVLADAACDAARP